jgi:aldehyde dehydrogenase (NAD+)
MVLGEITNMIKHLKKWSKPKRVHSPLALFKSKCYLMPEPYGVALIIAPWNYPFQLMMVPTVGAIAAGNCVVMKPANYSKHTTELIEEIITSNFDPQYISIFKGGREVNAELLEQKFDYIFFTGSPELGKIVMEKASKNLTPVTLELGGKSPCIVTDKAKLDISAKRLAWGKLVNAGQTCIAPDYLFVHSKVKDEFLANLKKYIKNSMAMTLLKVLISLE